MKGTVFSSKYFCLLALAIAERPNCYYIIDLIDVPKYFERLLLYFEQNLERKSTYKQMYQNARLFAVISLFIRPYLILHVTDRY